MDKPEKSLKKLTKKQKIWIIVGAILVIIIAVAVILITQKSGPEAPKTENTTSEENKKNPRTLAQKK